VSESVLEVAPDTESLVISDMPRIAKSLKEQAACPVSGRGSAIAAQEDIMQIPYDLEFVENRPVAIRAVALSRPTSPWDALLHWAFRLIRRFER
jgi:hypothetical protein